MFQSEDEKFFMSEKNKGWFMIMELYVLFNIFQNLEMILWSMNEKWWLLYFVIKGNILKCIGNVGTNKLMHSTKKIKKGRKS